MTKMKNLSDVTEEAFRRSVDLGVRHLILVGPAVASRQAGDISQRQMDRRGCIGFHHYGFQRQLSLPRKFIELQADSS